MSKNLYQKIKDVADIIANKARTGNANYIFTHPIIAKLIEEEQERVEKYQKRKRIVDKILKGNS